jgi:hypothetical protein
MTIEEVFASLAQLHGQAIATHRMLRHAECADHGERAAFARIERVLGDVIMQVAQARAAIGR